MSATAGNREKGSSSLVTGSKPGCSTCMGPGAPRDIPDEETTDWRAVCGKTARTVRRAGRVTFPTPIQRSRALQDRLRLCDEGLGAVGDVRLAERDRLIGAAD